MRPRIVPPNFTAALIKLVTVCSDQFVVEIHELTYTQNCVFGEMQLAFNPRGVNTRANEDERGKLDAWKNIWQRVDEFFVCI